MGKKFLIAASIASFTFFHKWRQILDPASDRYFFYKKTFPRWVEISAVTCNILLLAALALPVVFMALRSGTRRPVPAAQLALLAWVLIPLNALRLQSDALNFPNLYRRLGWAGLLLLGLCLLSAAAFAFRRFGVDKVTRAVASAFLIMSLFTPFAYVQGIWMAAKYEGTFAAPTPAAPPLNAGQGRGSRVLWLIFDELDYRLLYAERPASLEAPEFDRLRAEALYATDAYPPSVYTTKSLPALTTGRLVAHSKAVSPHELSLRLDGVDEWVSWDTLPNVFTRARAAGYDAAVVGWYLPYCRLFGASLTKCSWHPHITEDPPEEHNVAGNMWLQWREVVLSLPLVLRLLPSDVTVNHTRVNQQAAGIYAATLRDTLGAAADPGLDFVMVHMPVPHPPSFYDRASGRLALGRKNSYLDGLALVDRTLGEIRAAMERAGLWDSTAVLVSGDHWWRAREVHQPGATWPDIGWSAEDSQVMPQESDQRVPFVLKFPGRNEGTTYDRPFNTVLSADLLLNVLGGEVADACGADAWLDANKTISKSPYCDIDQKAAP